MKIKRYSRWLLLSGLCGLLAGIAAASFLILLDLATRYRLDHPSVILGLPIAGFALGWIDYRFGRDIAGGNNLILEQIHDPRTTIPLRMAPLILLGTVVTHLFGGSAGREGTAVQMGASLADQLSRFFKIDKDQRKILLVAGAGAGFGAAIGTPWAGIIFGMEVIQIGKLRLFAFFECSLASFVAFYTVKFLGAKHSYFPPIVIPDLDGQTLVWVLVAGIIFGLASRIFVASTHLVERTHKKYVAYPPLKPALAGVLLVFLYAMLGSYRYAGLGIPVIQQALEAPASILDPLYKTMFTALTVGSGFKGGEFVPLVFIGSTLGSALSVILPVSFQLLSALGFAALFAGAANTPLACSLMAMEIFGFGLAPYALLACYSSYYCSGHSGIYRSQKILRQKPETLRLALVWMGELPKRFLKNRKGS